MHAPIDDHSARLNIPKCLCFVWIFTRHSDLTLVSRRSTTIAYVVSWRPLSAAVRFKKCSCQPTGTRWLHFTGDILDGHTVTSI